MKFMDLPFDIRMKIFRTWWHAYLDYYTNYVALKCFIEDDWIVERMEALGFTHMEIVKFMIE